MLFWIGLGTFVAVSVIGEGLGWGDDVAFGVAVLSMIVITGISWAVRTIMREKFGDEIFNRDEDW